MAYAVTIAAVAGFMARGFMQKCKSKREAAERSRAYQRKRRSSPFYGNDWLNG